MTEHSRTWVRPRELAWGNEAQRAVLHAIAEDIAKRTDHKVAALEVLRADGYLEFVAIAGDEDARSKLLGQASPLALEHIVTLGQEMHGWRHIPGERIDDTLRAWLDQYGHKPDVPASDLPDGWDPDDQMVRMLEDADGELRGLLYLDEPLSGLRPTPEVAAAINADAGVLFEAIISIVERELYGEQVRMVNQARAAMQASPPGAALADFLEAMTAAMAERMNVDTADVVLKGDALPGLTPDLARLEEAMTEVWRRRGHLVVEREQTWGARETPVPTSSGLVEEMDQRGLASWLLVPIGLGDDFLGTLGLGRTAAGPRWTDSEVNAASVVAADLAGVVLDARIVERERELNAELRQLSDYRRDMVITLAHELRNPVMVLWSNLEIIQEDGAPDHLDGPLAALDRATRRIEDMVEDMMALGRVAEGHQVEREPVDLSAVVRDVGEFLAPMGSPDGVALDLDVGDGLVVDGEAAGLQRLVTNLLSNAVKYTPAQGRVAVVLRPEQRDGADGVVLVVADTGIGIAEDEVARVFSPFFRSSSPSARQRPGTGLGLAVVEEVVRLHGGTVELASVLGEGSTFTVWLPVHPAGPREP
ncbi:HAMP domain-containing histidine kinase [Nocardioides sp. J2M5]|uniref:sensor histidine kinase n=1 Tax=Nocardioides palaemonis TaxID=2829810 RepID=UPI001BA4F3AF|nr:HAMP domain-containing sensor histidine kinase [Nocardioides palaemonis]MBS2940029.1 HAMP domain-containing histidine kinase [Nocardioides palaemonis]